MGNMAKNAQPHGLGLGEKASRSSQLLLLLVMLSDGGQGGGAGRGRQAGGAGRPRQLAPHQVGIHPSRLQQLLVAALLRHLPMLDDHYAVGVLHCGQPVGEQGQRQQQRGRASVDGRGVGMSAAGKMLCNVDTARIQMTSGGLSPPHPPVCDDQHGSVLHGAV